VRGLTTLLLVGGLGVEDRLNKYFEISVVVHVIFFAGLSKKGRLLMKTKILKALQKITYTLLQSS